MPSIAWAVKGLLPQTGIGLFYGASGTGKSFLLLDLACCIAEGLSWFGHRTIRAPVIYLCLEGAAGFVGRVKAWEKGHGRSFPENVRVVLQPFSFLDTSDVSDLIKAVHSLTKSMSDELGPPLVIVDTLNRAMPGSDESGSQDIGLVLQACSLMSKMTAGLTLLAHHIGKDADRGPRGHSSLVPSVDASILVSRSKETRSWETKKVKDGSDGIKAAFRLETVAMGFDSDGDEVTSCIVQATEVEGVEGAETKLPSLSESQRLAVDTFRLAVDGARPPVVDELPKVTIEAWRVIYYQSCSAGSISGKRNSFLRARADLKELDFLEELNDEAHLTKTGQALLCPA